MLYASRFFENTLIILTPKGIFIFYKKKLVAFHISARKEI